MDLRSATIRLAAANAELRPYLIQVIAKEFPTEEALHTYLEEHPAADPKNHWVKGKKPEDQVEDDDDDGTFGNPEMKFKNFLGKLKGVGDAMKASLSKAPAKVKAFVSDPAVRKEAVSSMAADIKKSPAKVASAVFKSAKQELHEIQHAGKAIKKVLSKPPQTWTKEDYKAVYAASVYAASATVAAIGGGPLVAAGALGKGFAIHVGTKAMHRVLDHGFTHFELGEAALHALHHVLAADEDEKDQEHLMAQLTMAVGKVLEEGISDKDMEEILKEPEEPDFGKMPQPKAAPEKEKSATLRDQVIRLAHTNPGLRPHLLPILKEAFGGTHVPVRELPPTVQRALKDVGYGRRDIEVVAKSTVNLQSMGGDGYRSFTVVLNIETGESKTLYGSWGGPNPWSRPNPVDSDDREHTLPVNGAVIQGHEGGGRPVFATLYINPSNMAALLPAPVELSREEKKALNIIGGIKPGYRKDEFMRAGLGLYDTQNPYIVSLIKKGLVKLTGTGIQITVDGKNAR